MDSSALVALGAGEPDFDDYLTRLLAASQARIANINYVETGIILIGRGHLEDQTALDRWLARLGVTVADDAKIASTALEAYLTFGKGLHPARLNLADAFAYALARHLDAPLLYKGDDFALTDIRSALQPT